MGMEEEEGCSVLGALDISLAETWPLGL